MRVAARLLILDEHGRVLLVRMRDASSAECWATPGGGVDPGETLEEAARREAHEELGARVTLRDCVWERDVAWEVDTTWFRQREHFFRATLDGPIVVDARQWEIDGILEHRWIHPEDIDALAAPTFPPDLGALLADLPSGNVAEPRRIRR